MRPILIPNFISIHNQLKEVLLKRVDEIAEKITALHSDSPEITIIIPAYNEEDNILRTLSSLSNTSTKRTLEIIVVDNNSKDKTREYTERAGATCIFEGTQGITPARNAGLAAAKGIYIMNADADTIYPPDWIEFMIKPLEDPRNAMTYGNYAFIPTAGTVRPVYFFYEYLSDITKWKNKTFWEEAVNVYGFNSAFRREQGLSVDGFNHPPDNHEDGHLGFKLREKYGRLVPIRHEKAFVWTSDRRILIDGGVVKATYKRLKKNLINKYD